MLLDPRQIIVGLAIAEISSQFVHKLNVSSHGIIIPGFLESVVKTLSELAVDALNDLSLPLFECFFKNDVLCALS